MEEHYAAIKKIIMNIHYGESVSYEVGNLTEKERLDLVKITKKLCKTYLVNVHVRWSNNNTVMRIVEVM